MGVDRNQLRVGQQNNSVRRKDEPEQAITTITPPYRIMSRKVSKDNFVITTARLCAQTQVLNNV
ncbi:hypothetical protein [Burkholderia sp. BCC0044]|uniref:hypothetical protein n=1 Tax=Burkholderia sp. BCC0044 TaxID=2676295 RepID=UPI00158A6D82|nr:hypothetical protein [Burkholderia sp. BCC0044]